MTSCVCVLLDCPGETLLDCSSDTVVDDELKSATPLASSHRTRIIWHSSIATHSAGPVHRVSSVHRDVTPSQSKAAHSQREVVVGQQATLSALDQTSGGSLGVAEHIRPQVQANTSVRRSDNRSVNAGCTGAVKQSYVGVELADSEARSSSRCSSKTEHSKCSVNERRSSDAIASRHSFSDNSNTDAQTQVSSDKPSDVDRSEWNSVSNVGASVIGRYQTQTVSSRQVSIDSDHCEVTDSSRKQQSELAGKQQQSTATDGGRKQSADSVTKQYYKVADSGTKQFADSVTKQYCNVADGGTKQSADSVTKQYCNVADGGRKQSADSVTKQYYKVADGGTKQYCNVTDSGRKQQLWYDTDDSLQLFDDKDGGVGKPDRLHGWSDGVSKPERLRGWSDGVSKPGKFHGSSSDASSRGKLRL